MGKDEFVIKLRDAVAAMALPDFEIIASANKKLGEHFGSTKEALVQLAAMGLQAGLNVQNRIVTEEIDMNDESFNMFDAINADISRQIRELGILDQQERFHLNLFMQINMAPMKLTAEDA